jgi:hypothetical protein
MYAFAQTTAAREAAQGFLTKINEAILFPLITLMMAIALLIFLYGAFEYVKGAANEGDRETGRRHLLYGIIGMLVMLSAFTILTIAAATFELDDELRDSSVSGNFQDDGQYFFQENQNDNQFAYNALSNGNNDDLKNADSDADKINNGENNGVDKNTSSVAQTPDPFSDGIEPSFFGFYEDKINEAQQSGTITIEEIVGFFSLPNGDYPDNYLLYENTELMPICQTRGGADVFSISINNDTSRQFYCVKNL